MYENTLEFAKTSDASDPLRAFRDKFHMPQDPHGNSLIYLCGNSLGLQPKTTSSYIQQELKDWATLGVEGHTDAAHPWMPYHEFLTENMAEIVGARPHEVVIMNSLTVNLHLMMVSFYKPDATRYKILIESDAFPSDKYAMESQLRFHGVNPDKGLLQWKPRPGEELCRMEDLEAILETEGEQIALIMLGNTNYYSGQYYPMKKITEMGHQKGCMVGFDLAHGVGNIRPDLHDTGADFAVWCTYKYLNSGPGSLGGCFVHDRHAHNDALLRFTGWWGHHKASRFNMRQKFDPIPGAEGWQLSNPAILSMAAIRASLDIFKEAGMDALHSKSVKLTGFLEFLIDALNNDSIRIMTPRNPEERGCQLSLQVRNANKNLHTGLTRSGVISDWREPDVIRVAPAPLYNTYEEIYRFVQRFKEILNK